MNKILSFLMLLFLLSCSGEITNTNDCLPENPLNMEWMKEWVSGLQLCPCTVSVFQADYKEGVVFWQLMTDPLCQITFSEIQVYNCEGDLLLTIENLDQFTEFQNEYANPRIIYQCSRPGK